MQTSVALRLTTPYSEVLSTEAWAIGLPTAVGCITLLPGHADLVGELVPGELSVASTPTATAQCYLLHEGSFVLSGGQLWVMAQLAVAVGQLQPEPARAQWAAAQLAAAQLPADASAVQQAGAQRRLRRAAAQLQVLGLPPAPPPGPPAPAPGA